MPWRGVLLKGNAAASPTHMFTLPRKGGQDFNGTPNFRTELIVRRGPK